MDISIFEQITSALTIKSLCSPFGPNVPEGSTVDDVGELMREYGYEFISRVINSEGATVGLLRVSSSEICDEEKYYSGDEIVGKIMERVAPNELLSSNTTILDAVEIFGKKSDDYFYVIHINEVIGILRYGDLFKPLGRLAFLALALEIEDQALKLCQSASSRDRCWASLSENRKRKARKLFRDRYGRRPISKVGKVYFPK